MNEELLGQMSHQQEEMNDSLNEFTSCSSTNQNKIIENLSSIQNENIRHSKKALEFMKIQITFFKKFFTQRSFTSLISTMKRSDTFEMTDLVENEEIVLCLILNYQ